MAQDLHVKISDRLDEKLRVFCEVFLDASKTKIVEKALEAFIEKKLNENPKLREEFLIKIEKGKSRSGALSVVKQKD